ncbi:hypothetical protein KUH03_09660 [Sphingobacterium sp. E70]|uniref:hypothetical protein n=1 Tax=Sphingobacterium sp. E70 TaxID=2853439 RepID=UPI00211C3EB2|nr:hypothetical protein [Sphingobacterium sp. E70]ULT27040.1 hypothetical protein KUH03_09660 [Sphingobacterium sp. E70]
MAGGVFVVVFVVVAGFGATGFAAGGFDCVGVTWGLGTVVDPGVPVVGEGAVNESVTSILAPKLVNPFSTPEIAH